MATGDKYDPLIIPYCKPTPSQVLKLQSCAFLSRSEEHVVHLSSSQETSEQPSPIIMVSLPDSSSDDYQTPPEEHHLVSQTENVIDLGNDTEILDENGEKMVTEEAFDTELIESQTPQKDAHQVLDEMPVREQKDVVSDVVVLDRGKRKLPFSLEKKVTDKGECSRHDGFKETINRVLKMLVPQGKGTSDDGKCVDFLETAKKKGMTFPRPRWRSAETWKGL